MATFRKAERKQSKLRLQIQGPSGSGKTTAALCLATNMTPGKVAFIDTESGSAELYADKYEFDVLNLTDFEPEAYINAIQDAENAGYESLIIDSLTHEWERILELVDDITQASNSKNSYFAWGKVTPRHNKLVKKILQSKMHIIACARTKTEYIVETDKGKSVPKKVGTKAVQRDGLDYEFTIVFELSQNHLANCTKDRTSLFSERDPFLVDEKVAKQLMDWMNKGLPIKDYMDKIDALAKKHKVSADKVKGAKDHIEGAADMDSALAQIESRWATTQEPKK